MARSIKWSGRARSDLRLAIQFIAHESPDAATRFGSTIVAAARGLAEFPERGRVVPELNDPAVREIFLARYRIVYEVFADRIGVARIIHANRDFLAAWGRPAAVE